MNESKERKRGAILSYLSIIISTIIQLAYTPILINGLGQNEYGIYSLVASIIGYLSVLDLGFGDAIIQYTAQYNEKKEYEKEKKLHGMFLVIYTIIGLLVACIGFIVFLNVDNIFGKSMTIENLTMKLMWSLAHYKNITDIKNFMEKEL